MRLTHFPAWLLLCAAAAWAQPQAPTTIDSAEECKALGGAWILRGWQGACQTGWAREDCLRLGGAWTPLAGAPSGGLCMAPVSEQANARQCAAAGGEWGPAGSAMPYCRPATQARSSPVHRAPDAGKRCDSQGDCTYGCIYQGVETRIGADVMGRCRADNARSGCFWTVEAGRLAGRICLN
jgi:hypothetical protein